MRAVAVADDVESKEVSDDVVEAKTVIFCEISALVALVVGINNSCDGDSQLCHL